MSYVLINQYVTENRQQYALIASICHQVQYYLQYILKPISYYPRCGNLVLWVFESFQTLGIRYLKYLSTLEILGIPYIEYSSTFEISKISYSGYWSPVTILGIR